MRASSQHPQPLDNLRPNEIPAELTGLQVPHEEWNAILTIRPNVLVEGSDCSTEKLIRAVTAAIEGAFYDWESPPEQPELGATVIVRRVDLLTADEHRRLLDFISAEGARTRVRQVIATTAHPLYPLVVSGLFLADLYYRLNTIRLELGEAS